MHGTRRQFCAAKQRPYKFRRSAKQQNIAQKDKVEGKESEEDFTRVRHLPSVLSCTEFSKHKRAIPVDEFRDKIKNNTGDYDVHCGDTQRSN